MITLPSSAAFPRVLLYTDSDDLQLSYIDIRTPAPVNGSHVLRWMLLPENRAFLSGEIRYAPTMQDYSDIVPSKRRSLPMPWSSSPVYVWNPRELLAKGKTSGMGMSNAVLSASTTIANVGLPLVVAAELTCKARLANLSVDATGDIESVKAIVGALRLGETVEWDTSIADVLVSVLSDLVVQGGLTIRIESNILNDTYKDEVTQLVILEWAYRLVACGTYAGLTLPASHYNHLQMSDNLDLNIHWRHMDLVTMRAIRAFRCDDIPV